MSTHPVKEELHRLVEELPTSELHAATGGRSSQLPEGRGFYLSRHAACAWRQTSPAAVARSLPCAPRKLRKQVITRG